MWAIEAKNFGENPDYFYLSGLTEAESRKKHKQFSNSGEWAFVRTWSKTAEWEQQSDLRIKQWGLERQDGLGEGQFE